jgi:hypothetical protein
MEKIISLKIFIITLSFTEETQSTPEHILIN